MKDYHIDPDEYILFSTKVRQIAGIILNEQYEEQEAKRKQQQKKG